MALRDRVPEPLRQPLLTLARYVEAVVSPRSVLIALRAFPRFLADRRAFAALPGAPPLRRSEDLPQLLDRTATTPFEPHYTFQDGWAAREVARLGPDRHVDVGSRISFPIGLSAFVQVTFVDLRPLEVDLPGLTCIEGSLLSLPFADRSLPSLSCLHVAEHVGLGRYGDELDPEGTAKAAQELQRVLAPGGTLLLGLPVGRERVEFNAHRVHDPLRVPELFPELRLDGFAGVDDDGRFHPQLDPGSLRGARWGCGLYRLRRD